MNDQETRDAHEFWWHKSQHIVMKEANLTYLKNELHLRFKPDVEGKKERKDGSLHGTYESLVITEEGETQVTDVAPDWVGDNVSEGARDVVLRACKDWNTKFIDKKGKVEFGYLSLKGNDNRDEFKLPDDRQVSMIRYIPAKDIVTSRDKVVHKPEQWKGVIKETVDGPVQFVFLSQEWIDENISKKMQGFVKKTDPMEHWDIYTFQKVLQLTRQSPRN
jgi:hypothetical protein